MKITYKDITIDIEARYITCATAWEKSRAFRILWKKLWMPKATFRSDSYTWWDSLTVNLKDKIDNKTRNLINEFRAFFESWRFNWMEDIYELKENNSNPFSFKYAFINELRE